MTLQEFLDIVENYPRDLSIDIKVNPEYGVFYIGTPTENIDSVTRETNGWVGDRLIISTKKNLSISKNNIEERPLKNRINSLMNDYMNKTLSHNYCKEERKIYYNTTKSLASILGKKSDYVDNYLKQYNI